MKEKMLVDISEWIEEKVMETEVLFKYGDYEKAKIIKQLIEELINL